MSELIQTRRLRTPVQAGAAEMLARQAKNLGLVKHVHFTACSQHHHMDEVRIDVYLNGTQTNMYDLSYREGYLFLLGMLKGRTHLPEKA